ncbi:fluoride efflux transporter CrcB [Conexibacter arvalis]|uniref:Fluoride-specific ion channel FluC n=1 Tax=Conexibacter arvalis TaxID=912552 RepID=A0A840IAS9_9ACTN|nr:fluoride efflux transporter CrcB [Conexibacter arvalis]MBB4661224.1 CrcB protein [Conexibacter arvalis]
MSGLLVWAAVGLLGGVGAVARVVVGSLVTERSGGRFPLGTLTVNLSGAAALGLLSGLALDGDAMLVVGTALVGGYTTFSTWMLESWRLAEAGAGRLLALNLAGSVALGVAAIVLGQALGGALG